MQRRAHRTLHSEDDIVKVHTPSKRMAVLERADANAVPPPLSAAKPAKRVAPQQQQPPRSSPRRRRSSRLRHSDGSESSESEHEVDPDADADADDEDADVDAPVTPARSRFARRTPGRSSRKPVAAATPTAAAAATPTAAAAALTATATATAAASPSTSSTSTSAAAPADASDPVRDSSSFLIMRSLFMLLIFVVLFSLTQWYVLDPLFHPQRTDAYKRMQEAKMRQHIAEHICPPGESCDYNLDDFHL